MDAVVVGIAIDEIEVEFRRHEVDALRFSMGQTFEHALHEAMLDALPAPARVFVLVVGSECLLPRVRWRGQADSENGPGRDLVKRGEESIRVVEHFVDSGVGGSGTGSEAVVDAKQKGDDVGRLIATVFFEVTRQIEDASFAIRRRKDEGLVVLRASGPAVAPGVGAVYLVRKSAHFQPP